MTRPMRPRERGARLTDFSFIRKSVDKALATVTVSVAEWIAHRIKEALS